MKATVYQHSILHHWVGFGKSPHRGHTGGIAAVLAVIMVVFGGALTFNGNHASAQGHHRMVSCIAFSADGRLLATGSHDRTIKVWNTDSGKRLQVFRGHEVAVSDLAFTDGGDTLVSSGWGGHVMVWDVRGGKRKRTMQVQSGTAADNRVVTGLDIGPDGTMLATTGLDKTLRLWNLDTGEKQRSYSFGGSVPDAVSFGPNGNLLAVGTRKKTIHLLDVDEWRERWSNSTSADVSSVFVESDGSHVITGARKIQAWSVDSGEPVKEIRKDDLETLFAASTDTFPLASFDGKGTVWIWSGWSDDEPKSVEHKGANLSAIALSGDGSLLAVGSRAGRIRVVRTKDTKQRFSIDPGKPEGTKQPKQRDPGKLADRNLLSKELRSSWQFRSDAGALQWNDASDGSTLSFRAATIPTHMVGKDFMNLGLKLGPRPFEVNWSLAFDEATGHGAFRNGITFGVSSAPVGGMTEKDAAILFAFQFHGLYAGVAKGELFEQSSGYGQLKLRSEATPDGVRVGINNTVKGTYSTGDPVRFRVTRNQDHRLTFTAWCPSAGQSPADPWWKGSVTLPEKWRDTSFRNLFIKKIPVKSTHTGAQGTGYGEGLDLMGTFRDIRVALDPPVLREVSVDDTIPSPGATVTITGENLKPDATVRIGNQTVKDVRQVDASTLKASIPSLDPGRRYGVEVTNPGGASDTLVGVIPVGRYLESASLIQTEPDAGRTVTLEGAGFEPDTKVFFGEKKAEVVERVSTKKIKVTVPNGEPGAAFITAKTGKHKFHETLPFAYAERPNLWFTEDQLTSFRKRSKQAPWTAYRSRILEQARNKLEDGPSKSQQILALMCWAYMLTGETDFRDRIIKMATAISKSDKTGGCCRRQTHHVGLAYDLAAPAMNESQLKHAQRYLMRRADEYLRNEEEDGWYEVNNSSTSPARNIGPLIVALLFPNARTDADEVIAKTKHHLLDYGKAGFSPNMAPGEGMSRGLQGLNDYLEAGTLLKRHRNDGSLLKKKKLTRLGRLYRTLLVNESRRLGFLNTKFNLGAMDGSVAAFAAARRTDPLLHWLADKFLASGSAKHGHHMGLGLVWRSDQKSPERPPSVPVLSTLPYVNWGILRSEGTLNSTFVVGATGGHGPYSYHHQNDPGSLNLFAGGEELIVDPGWGNSSAKKHSVPIVDGRGPDTMGGFLTDRWKKGPWRAFVLDTSQAYRPWGIRRVRRTVVMHQNGTVIVLDDVKPDPEKAGRVRSFFQVSPDSLELNNHGARVVRGRSRLDMKFFGPEIRVSSSKREHTHHGDPWRAVTAAYTAQPGKPMVTVIRASDEKTVEPVEADVSYGDGTIRVNPSSTKTRTFVRTETGWALRVKESGKKQLLNSAPPQLHTPEVTAKRVEEPPELDGELTEKVWQKAPPATNFVVKGWGSRKQRRARYRTEVRFAYDPDRLYIAVRAFEPNLDGLKTDLTGPAQETDGLSRIELFIDPGQQESKNRFWNRFVLANGRDLGKFGKGGDLGSHQLKVAAGRKTGENAAWILEMSVAWEDVMNDPWNLLEPFQPESGTKMGLTIQRHRMQHPKETSTWTRPYQYPEWMPWRWGVLKFE